MESVTHAHSSPPSHENDLRGRAQPTLRTLAAISSAGALAGVLIGGVGGRLAMMLLARLNPQALGVKSDDGFIIGRFKPWVLRAALAAAFLTSVVDVESKIAALN